MPKILLLAASYAFYTAFAYQFLWLLAFVTATAFFLGIVIEKTEYKKTVLTIGITIFLVILAYFKYRNFFLETFSFSTTTLLLPLGISFYLFESIGYLIDVKRGQRAERNYVQFALFIAFFPKVILGPIERAAHFIPQKIHITWNNITIGLFIALWGIFKKIVIADQLGAIASNHTSPLFTAYIYAFQLYFDFSGYTDIAIGTSKVFGIDLLQNFNRPYASASIAEFWRRWHMSLSFWLRDYLYIPLGGSRVSPFRKHLNIMIVFLLSGLWHGAGWTFIVWGIVHGMLMVLNSILSPFLTWVPRIIKVICTFHLVALTWILFYSPTLSDALQAYKRLPEGLNVSWTLIAFLIAVIGAVEGIEWARGKMRLGWVAWPASYALMFAIIMLGRYEYSFLYVRF